MQFFFPGSCALEVGLGAFLLLMDLFLISALCDLGKARGQHLMPRAGNALRSQMEPTSHPPRWLFPGVYHDNTPFYLRPLCRLWMSSMSYSCFKGSKRIIEMKALDLKDLAACILSLVLQFPLHLKNPTYRFVVFSDGATLASMYRFSWVCRNWQHLLYPDSLI